MKKKKKLPNLKFFIYSLALIAVSLSIAYFLAGKPPIKTLNKAEPSNNILITTETPPSQRALNPTITPSLTPKYSVTISGKPIASAHGFSFEITLKNVSIKPYITNFAFYECEFKDSENNSYKGSMMDEKVLDKAILPGESATINFNDANTTIKNLERRDDSSADEKWLKCAYNEDGQYSCNSIQGMRITSCIAYISTTREQASNGWGRNPLNVQFP